MREEKELFRKLKGHENTHTPKPYSSLHPIPLYTNKNLILRLFLHSFLLVRRRRNSKIVIFINTNTNTNNQQQQKKHQENFQMDVKLKGSAIRIRNCAFDLLSIRDFMEDEDESWELIRRDLHLKSTFLFCDFNQLISDTTEDDEKKTLVELANRLFYYIEELDEAVKLRNISLAENRYLDIAVVLEEIMAWPSFLVPDIE